MKLVWILFNILLDVARKLFLVVIAFYLVVAIGMGIYWVLFEAGAGLILAGITVLVIFVKVAGAAAGNAEK